MGMKMAGEMEVSGGMGFSGSSCGGGGWCW